MNRVIRSRDDATIIIPAVAISNRVKYSARCLSFSIYRVEESVTKNATDRNTIMNSAEKASSAGSGSGTRLERSTSPW